MLIDRMCYLDSAYIPVEMPTARGVTFCVARPRCSTAWFAGSSSPQCSRVCGGSNLHQHGLRLPSTQLALLFCSSVDHKLWRRTVLPADAATLSQVLRVCSDKEPDSAVCEFRKATPRDERTQASESVAPFGATALPLCMHGHAKVISSRQLGWCPADVEVLYKSSGRAKKN